MIPFNEDVAFRVNIISPLVSALAVMLLYLSIVKVVTHWRGKVNSSMDSLIVFGGGVSNEIDFLSEIETIVKKYVIGKEYDGVFLKPKYGDASGVRGAARLGRTTIY